MNQTEQKCKMIVRMSEYQQMMKFFAKLQLHDALNGGIAETLGIAHIHIIL